MENNTPKNTSRLVNIWSKLYKPHTLVALLVLLAVATIAYTQYGKVTTIPSSADTNSIVAPPATCNYYASPTGSSSGDGSLGNPWDLQTALNQPPALVPGSTLCLRGGTYPGRFISQINGNAGSRILVKSHDNEQATIDGNKIVNLVGAIPSAGGYTSGVITVSDSAGMVSGNVIKVESEDMQVSSVNGNVVNVTRGWSGTTAAAHPDGVIIKLAGSIMTIGGSYTSYQNLEIVDSSTQREGDRVDDVRGTGANITGSNVKMINNIIHDTGMGVGFWLSAVDSELYGNIIYNNGSNNTSTTQCPCGFTGHGIYAANDQGLKTISDNIVFNQIGYGLHVYSTNSVLSNFLFKGNIHFNDQWLIGGHTPATNINIRENYFYNGPLSIGYSDTDNSDITIADNYAIDGMQLSKSKNVTVTGNTVWGWSNGNNAINVSVRYDGTNNQVSDYVFSGNTYYQPTESWPNHQFGVDLYPPNPSACGYVFYNRNSPNYPYGNCTLTWQEDLQYDLNSTFISSNPPSASFVRPNQYDSDRAHVIVYNWDSASTVNVNLSGTGFNPGDTFVLRNAQNYFAETITLTSNGSNQLSVPMTGWTIAEPIGANSNINSSVLGESTYPKFGVFVLVRTNNGTPTPDTTPPVLSSGSPTGSQPAGTTSTNLTLSTNETSTCKYGTTANVAYASLPSTFTTTNSTSHSTTVSSLSNGTSYTYYIRCQDTSSNPTTQDFTISFSVANSTTTPTGGGGGGGGGGSGGGGNTTPSTTTTGLVNASGTYYLLTGGYRKGVTSPGIMYSCGFEFKDARTATPQDLTLPTSLLLPCGGALVKSVVDPTVYLISRGQRYAFTSSQVFTGLGFKFSSVLTVTNPELQALPQGSNLSSPSSAHLPEVDININGTIYWLDTNLTKHPYPSLQVWNSWHRDGDFTTVVPANQNDLNLTTGSNVPMRF